MFDSVLTRRHRNGDSIHPRGGEQRRFDLAEFNPEATQLDLGIGSTEIFESVAVTDRDVAAAVHPSPVAGERVRDEAHARQFGAAEVPPRHLRATDVDLAGRSVWHRPQVLVEHVDLEAR
ncbi:Uncharacterised protein [Mycobacteroides abscessus subsp. abscessus]|nr:Uncharacterised protein [Mycobacteroides abscessus subsp. abscessus]